MISVAWCCDDERTAAHKICDTAFHSIADADWVYKKKKKKREKGLKNDDRLKKKPKLLFWISALFLKNLKPHTHIRNLWNQKNVNHKGIKERKNINKNYRNTEYPAYRVCFKESLLFRSSKIKTKRNKY